MNEDAARPVAQVVHLAMDRVISVRNLPRSPCSFVIGEGFRTFRQGSPRRGTILHPSNVKSRDVLEVWIQHCRPQRVAYLVENHDR